jgi:hypothetical protein
VHPVPRVLCQEVDLPRRAPAGNPARQRRRRQQQHGHHRLDCGMDGADLEEQAGHPTGFLDVKDPTEVAQPERLGCFPMPAFRFEVVAANAPKLVESFYDRIWNQGNLEAAEQLLTSNFAFRGSLGAERDRHNR